MPDVITLLHIPGLRHNDFADLSGVDVLDCLTRDLAAARLRAVLNNPAITTRGFDHQSAFPDVVRARLLKVNVLACIAGQNGRRSMPVIGCRDHHSIDRLVIKDATHIPQRFRRFLAGLLDSRCGCGDHAVIDIHQILNICVGEFGEPAGQRPTTSADSDDREIDTFARCRRATSRHGSGKRREEIATFHRSMFSDSETLIRVSVE